MEEDEKKLIYTCSVGEQEETKQIRQEHLRPEENKMEQLRELDESTTKKGMAVSLVLGIVSTFFLGVGMCCIMVWADTMLTLGIGIDLLGIAGIGVSLPLYRCITKRQRKKPVSRIMEFTNELMK